MPVPLLFWVRHAGLLRLTSRDGIKRGITANGNLLSKQVHMRSVHGLGFHADEVPAWIHISIGRRPKRLSAKDSWIAAEHASAQNRGSHEELLHAMERIIG
jgi:hypothetical protein